MILAADWYFSSFENRQPPPPVPHSPAREFVTQVLATASVVLGISYLIWRFTDSLNPRALWFAIPLLLAECMAFVGSVLTFLNLWRTRDTPMSPPPRTVNEILGAPFPEDRPLSVDVFFPTYNEDVELVRLSVRDAKAMTYPHPIDLRIHVLDDGQREAMRAVAEEEGVGYLTRQGNVGFKAGNMRNALENTGGDLLVICDADTRPFSTLLERTLGYFRDPTVAWVQTPQWFYDLEEGHPLPEWLAGRLHLGRPGRLLGRVIERLIGPIQIGRDLFANDPQVFYDLIQRRRNWCNASFCCGAGSIHRREAVMEAALKAYAEQVNRAVHPFVKEVEDPLLRSELRTALLGQAASHVELTPYKFHVSEDIYTSLLLHCDKDRHWRSVFHPIVESKMLSPQDLLTWTIQRFKYAGGTLDIFWNDKLLRRPGPSTWQRLMYGTTIYSYLAPLWTVPFLLAPIIYLFTGIAPLSTYSGPFYAHLVPFLLANKLAFMSASWGVRTFRGEQHYLSFFWINLRAMRDVLAHRPIKFHVTPKTRQTGNFLGLAWPHLCLIGLYVAGLAFRGAWIWGHGGAGLPSYLVNAFWSLNNMLSLSVIVASALRRPS